MEKLIIADVSLAFLCSLRLVPNYGLNKSFLSIFMHKMEDNIWNWRWCCIHLFNLLKMLHFPPSFVQDVSGDSLAFEWCSPPSVIQHCLGMCSWKINFQSSGYSLCWGNSFRFYLLHQWRKPKNPMSSSCLCPYFFTGLICHILAITSISTYQFNPI